MRFFTNFENFFRTVLLAAEGRVKLKAEMQDRFQGKKKGKRGMFGKVAAGKKLGCFIVRVDCDLNDLIDSR